MKMTNEEILKQIGEALLSYPDRNPEKACADCRVFPSFEVFQFNCYEKLRGPEKVEIVERSLPRAERWELSMAREDYTGWVTYSVIGATGPFNVKICPKCAKKRTMI